MVEHADRMVIHDEVIGADGDRAGKCASNAVPAQPLGHFLGRRDIVHRDNGYSRIPGRRDYPSEGAADAAQSVDADRNTHRRLLGRW